MKPREGITESLDHKHALNLSLKDRQSARKLGKPNAIKRVRFLDNTSSDSEEFEFPVPKKHLLYPQNKDSLKKTVKKPVQGPSFLRRVLLFFTWPIRKIWEIYRLPSKTSLMDDLDYMRKLCRERDEAVFLYKKELKEKDALIEKQSRIRSDLKRTDKEIETETPVKPQVQDKLVKSLLQRTFHLQEVLSGSIVRNRNTFFYRGYPVLDTDPTSEQVSYFNPSSGVWEQTSRLNIKRKFISSDVVEEKKQESKYSTLMSKPVLAKESTIEKPSQNWFQSMLGSRK